MRLITKLVVISLFFTLTACSYFSTPSFIKNRDRAYLKAKSIPPLHIPPGVSTQSIHNEYPVVDRSYPENNKEVSLVPPGL